MSARLLRLEWMSKQGRLKPNIHRDGKALLAKQKLVVGGPGSGDGQLTAADSSASHQDVLVVAFDDEGFVDRCTNDLAGQCDKCGDDELITEHVDCDRSFGIGCVDLL
jgi:hypothetical protein